MRLMSIGWVVLLCPAAFAAAPDVRPLRLEAMRPDTAWEGQQFVQADRRGRVFLLRAKELAVYPVEGGRILDKRAERLEPSPPEQHGVRLRCAMGGGGEWVLLEGGAGIRFFPDGREQPIGPVPWPVVSVAVVQGQPIATVLPVRLRAAESQSGSKEVPLVVRWDGDEWTELGRDPIGPDVPAPGQHWTSALPQQRRAVLAGGLDGSIWVGYEFRHVIRHFSPSGRLLLSLIVDGGTVDDAGAEEVARRQASLQERAQAVLKKRGEQIGARPTEVQVSPRTARPVITSLAAGHDGRVYILVRASQGSGFELERYDPIRALLEEVPLALSYDGVVSLAAGREGLYLAAFQGSAGRWWIPWERLDQAPWAPVAGVQINGMDAR